MVDLERPDPDSLLASIKQEEAKTKRGRLKIFFGMAPGAGKTYAMLEAALKLHRSGTDVVIGYVETHGRIETDALTVGLPVIPRKPVLYRGVTLGEMDLDAVLARRPALAVIDELAHTNAPGARHPKRYQDILELLEDGIDVYSTLNVQHLESCVGTMRDITGVAIQETVPDSILDNAEVEIVDISPEDLLARLDEGKIYVPDRAAAAMQNFFRAGNLVALRELALRVATERVGQDVRDYMQAQLIAGPWKTGHRLLVGVSASPYSEQLVRWTRRLADGLKCKWLAVHVETSHALSEENQARLTRNLSLAKTLGAEIRSTTDDDLVRGLLRVARSQNVTQIIVGKPERAGLPFRANSLLSRLVRQSGDIDIHIVRVEGEAKSRGSLFQFPAASEMRQYVHAILSLIAITLLNLAIAQFVGARSVALIYLFVVIALAMRSSRGPVYVAATLSALTWNFLFLPPRFTFHIYNFDDVMMFAMFFIVATALGHLISRIRAKERMDRRREERATAIYMLTLELADATSQEQIVRVAVDNVERVFRASAMVLLPNAHGRLEGSLSEKELATAQWAFDHVKPAGKFTDTLPVADAMHLPLAGSDGVLGVLGVRWKQTSPPTLEQSNMLEGFQRHIALVLDRHRLREAEADARIHAASERLQAALLDSISHELKTPLTVISSAAEQMTENPLAREIRLAAQRLIRVVDQLLDITRLNTGLFKPNMEGCDVRELLQTTVNDMGDKLQTHTISIDVEGEIPAVSLDFQLIKQALMNLLANAVAYSPSGSKIHLTARAENGEVVIAVADRGSGLQENERDRVFEKFYRGAQARPGGMGLGLSIVKRLAEAHEGHVSAENRPGGGAVFSIRLPLRPVEVPM